jgi:hypothetical protein
MNKLDISELPSDVYLKAIYPMPMHGLSLFDQLFNTLARLLSSPIKHEFTLEIPTMKNQKFAVA